MLRSRHQFVQLGAERPQVANSVRLMQWNMLARGLALADGMPKTDPANLDWDGIRFPMMVQELTRYAPHIISVEELDQNAEFMKALEPQGYKFLYVANPDSPCLSLKPPSKFGPDGVALIYNTTKVDLVSHEIVHLPMPPDDKGQPRHKVSISAIVKLKNCDVRLRIVVVHLKAKKEFAAVRAEQIQHLTNYLAQKTDDSGIATIISGDFNGEPDEPAIQMAIKAGFSSAIPLSATNIYSTAKFQTDRQDKTKAARHVRLIDYIFYKNKGNDLLRPRQYLQMPNLEDLGPTLLPNENYPSDHLSLVVDFDVFS